MAEPFKQTPASRVFGFGLRPQRTQGYQPTLMGIPLLEDRENLSPFLRQNAFEEQQMAAQEEALAAQQQIAMRNQQIMDAEMAAEQDLAAGEQLGNIFKKNPALAFSRNARQFVSNAQMMQPSYAMKAAIPSLAMKLPIEERGIFNQLLNDPEFSTNPFAAYDEAQRRSARARQHSELRKAGVPLSKIDTTRDYSPIEYEDLIQQHKQKSANPRLDYLKDFMDNVGKRVAAFEESDGAFDEEGNPTKALVDLRNKYAQISDLYDQEMMGLVMPKQAASDAVTAQKITSPAAEGGAPAAVVPGTSTESPQPIIPTKPQDFVAEIQSMPILTPQDAILISKYTDSNQMPIEAKNAAVKKLADALKDTSLTKRLDIESGNVLRASIQQAYDAAKNNLELEKMVERDIRPAWTKAKQELEPAVKEYAKKIGHDEESVWRSIASRKPVTKYNDKGVMVGSSSPAIEILGENYMKPNKHLASVGDKIAKINNFQSPLAARINRLLGGEERINGDVLHELAKEKVAAMDGGGSVESVTSKPKIEIGKPKPVQ